ncbi:MAG: ATP-binding protein [Candidatus Omnitrophota bacterium]
MLNLMTFNRWWDTGRVEPIYLKPYKRPLFFELIKFLDTRQILLIYGLRRVGKTTLMYQLIDFLLEKGTEKKIILYFSFDERISSLEELFRTYVELVLGKDILKENRVYVFLDEIQKLPDWQNQLKLFYDLYPNVKFVVSGSASLIIAKGTNETLAGRVYEFILSLLNFPEYLSLVGPNVPPFHDIFDFSTLKEIYLKRDSLSPFFFSYLKKGGFIEIATEEDDLKIKEYAKSILDKMVFGDIPLSFSLREPQVLKTIVELVASNPGFLLDYSKLAETLNKDQRVVANYIFYLKYSLLVKLLYNFSPSKFVSERKLKKIYLISTNFIYQLFSERFSNPDFVGKIVENLVVTSSQSTFFWRERQAEVDLVMSETIPLEIKYKNTLDKDDVNGILRFADRFKSRKAIILTKEILKEDKIEGLPVYFIPVWLYLLKT